MIYNSINSLYTKHINRVIRRKQQYVYKTSFTVCATLLFIFISSFFNISKANIAISSLILDFKPNDLKQKHIELVNHKKETSYIDGKIYEIINPGSKQQRRFPLKKENKRKIIVTPNRLTLREKERKLLRFISTEKHLTTDKIYRITIIPKTKNTKGNGRGIGIHILIGYEVLAIVRPENMIFDLNMKRNVKKNTITYKNNGNTNILLDKVVQCNIRGENCKNLTHTRLYAGNEFTLTLPYKKTKVVHEVHYADRHRKEISRRVPENTNRNYIITNHGF